MATGTLHLLRAPVGSGKTSTLLNLYGQFLADWQQDVSRPAGLWVCPSQAAVDQIRNRLVVAAGRALLHPQVQTFASYAAAIVSGSGSPIRPLDPLEEQRLLRHAIDHLASEKQLPYFRQVLSTTGFLRTVDQFIAQLKRKDIWPEDYLALPHDRREHELGRIYSEFQRLLHALELYDAEGCFWKAREVVETGLAEPRGMVVVDGFTSFTAAQHDILRLLANQGADLYVSLPGELPGGEPEDAGRLLLFAPCRVTQLRLEQDLSRIENLRPTVAPQRAPELQQLEENLFREEPLGGEASTPAALSIIAASSEQTEYQEVGRRIKQLLFTGEALPDEILIVVRSLAEARPRLLQVAHDCGLPLALSHNGTLADAATTRTLLTLLELRARDWPFELLLEVLASRQVQFDAYDSEDRSLRTAAERCIRKAQLPHGNELLVEQVRRWAQTEESADSEGEPRGTAPQARPARLALPLFENLHVALAELPVRAPLETWFEILTRASQRLLAAPSDANHQLLLKNLQKVARLDARLELSTREFSLAEVIKQLEWIAQTTLPAGRLATRGRIQVATPATARPLRARHVFLTGLGEESFSSVDHQAEVDNLSTLPGIDPAEQGAAESMLQFYEAVTRADCSLTLSYTALDSKGQTLSASPFLREVERSLAPARISRLTMPSRLVFCQLDTALSGSEWRLGTTQALLAGEYQPWQDFSSPASLRSTATAILAGLECVGSRATRDQWGPFEGMLLSEDARAVLAERFNSEHLWSPSQLETFAECPFRFLASHLLRMQPIDELALKSDYLRRGSLMHQVLEAVHAQARQADEDLDRQQIISRLKAVLRGIVQQTPLGKLEEALREIECREISSWADDYADQEIKYREQWHDFDQPLRPAHFEVRFGPKVAEASAPQDPLSTARHFQLDLPGEQICLTGQIDRIDLGRIGGVTVFNVIDYKTSTEIKFNDEEIASGRKLQLPLYMLAAENLLLAECDAAPLATGYWTIKKNGFPDAKKRLQCHEVVDEQLVPSARWRELPATLHETLERLVTQIRGGQFPVFNENQQCTASCDFSKICRVGQVRNLEKTWPLPEEATP